MGRGTGINPYDVGQTMVDHLGNSPNNYSDNVWEDELDESVTLSVDDNFKIVAIYPEGKLERRTTELELSDEEEGDDDDHSSEQSVEKPRRRGLICLCLAIVTIAIGTAIALGITLSDHRDVRASAAITGDEQVPTEESSVAPVASSPGPSVSPLTFQPVVAVSVTTSPTLSPTTSAPTSMSVATELPVTTEPTAVSIRDLLQPMLLVGNEFDDPYTYQSKSLYFMENNLTPQPSAEAYKTYFVLANIYYATNGVPNKHTSAVGGVFSEGVALPGWVTVANWVTDTSYCIWYGITCNDDGTIQKIFLPENNLFGSFPPEIEYFGDTLEELDLFNNAYLSTEGDAGNAWIGKMTNLRKLYFGSTSFEYTGIPTFIGQLSLLEELDVSQTLFVNGPIPDEVFANLPQLVYVDLARNAYTSSLPSSLITHQGVEFFYLDEVTFTTAPHTLDFLTTMPMISEAWCDFTEFDGGLPTGLGSLQKLQSLSLSYCTLSGTIPTELGMAQVLDRMWLYQNQLTGTIPTEISNLQRMQYLFLEGNKLSGSMPVEMCSLLSTNGLGLLENIGADCDAADPFYVECSCCTCCGAVECLDFE